MTRALILFTRVLEDAQGAQAVEDEFTRLLSGIELKEGEKVVSVQYNEIQSNKEYALIVTIASL